MTVYYITYQWVEETVSGDTYRGFGNSTISVGKLTTKEIEKFIKTNEGQGVTIHPISITKLDD